MNQPPIQIEISQRHFRALDGDEGLEAPLERLENGDLSPACQGLLKAALNGFLQSRRAQGSLTALCAVSARGVSMRRLKVPAASRDDSQKLLLLQVESEFPLPPSELAWGFVALGETNNGTMTAPVGQEFLVIAVKRDVIDAYAGLLSECGVSAEFTLGALARSALCNATKENFSMLDLDAGTSEWISFEQGLPTSLRVLSELDASNPSSSVQNLVDGAPTSKKLYVSASSASLQTMAVALCQKSNSIPCQLLETRAGNGRSAATLGLQKSVGHNDPHLIFLKTSEVKIESSRINQGSWKLAIATCILVLLSLSIRYFDGVFLTSKLAGRVAEIKAQREKLPLIDRELGFFRYLKTNQPPVVDLVGVIAAAAPQGARVESLSLTRRGELALRTSMRDAMQLVDFRSKLMESHFFSSVVVDEQVPTQNNQKLVVRMTAQWRRPTDSEAAEITRLAAEKTKGSTNSSKPLPSSKPAADGHSSSLTNSATSPKGKD